MKKLLMVFVAGFAFSCGSQDGSNGSNGADGKDSVESTTTCKLEWSIAKTEQIQKGYEITYTVMKFTSGDVIASLAHEYYNNDFRHYQSSTTLWPKGSEASSAKAGDSTFQAELTAKDKAIIKKLFNGEIKEVRCAVN